MSEQRTKLVGFLIKEGQLVPFCRNVMNRKKESFDGVHLDFIEATSLWWRIGRMNIDCAFKWASTPEGHDHWYRLYHKFIGTNLEP